MTQKQHEGATVRGDTMRTDRETYTVSAANIGFKVTPVSCALERELNLRKGDPVTRLHNLCAALEEDKNDSPYSAVSWELQDQAYKDKCTELADANAEIARLREYAGKEQDAGFDLAIAKLDLWLDKWGEGLSDAAIIELNAIDAARRTEK